VAWTDRPAPPNTCNVGGAAVGACLAARSRVGAIHEQGSAPCSPGGGAPILDARDDSSSRCSSHRATSWSARDAPRSGSSPGRSPARAVGRHRWLRHGSAQRDNQAAARHPQHDWAHGAWILNRHVGRGIRQSSTGGGRDADDGLEVGPSPFRNHPVFVSIGVNRASGGLAGVENEDVSRGGQTLVRYLR